MEAIIISLLLFFSNTDFSLGYINQSNTARNTSEHTSVYEEDTENFDETTVECSSGGKIGGLDLEGL